WFSIVMAGLGMECPGGLF
ncbi:hypothetical protein CBR_g64534, partial [Chara braunii]